MASNNYKSPCLYFNLRKAARLMGLVYDRHFRQIGLRGTQYSLLMAIERLEGPSVGELSEALGLEQSTVTRNIELLIQKCYVESNSDVSDSRRRILAVSRTGRDKITEAGPVWEAAQKELISRLGEKDTTKLIKMMDKLIEALD